MNLKIIQLDHFPENWEGSKSATFLNNSFLQNNKFVSSIWHQFASFISITSRPSERRKYDKCKINYLFIAVAHIKPPPTSNNNGSKIFYLFMSRNSFMSQISLEWRACCDDVNRVKGTFRRDWREMRNLLWKWIRRLRLFVNNKSRLPRLNPSFVVDFPRIIVFCCFSFSFAPLFKFSYQKLFCFFHFTLWKEEKIVCARKCEKGFHRHRCVSTPP